MTAFERWGVWITSLLVVVTGAGLLWVRLFVTPADPFAVYNHPLEPWLLKSHIVVSPLLLFSLGVIAVRHVWAHYVSGRPWARRTGIAVTLLVGPMVLTGYLIQVLTDVGWIRAMAWAHIATGTLYALVLVLHRLAIRRPSNREGGRPAVSRRLADVRTARRRPGGALLNAAAPSSASLSALGGSAETRGKH